MQWGFQVEFEVVNGVKKEGKVGFSIIEFLVVKNQIIVG